MKKITIIVLSLLFTAVGNAEIKPLSSTCAQLEGEFEVTHTGYGFYSFDSFYAKLKFERGKSGFGFDFEHGRDRTGLINYEAMTIQYVRNLGMQQMATNCAADVESCMQRLQTINSKLMTAQMRFSDENSIDEERALECAIERLTHFAESVRDRFQLKRRVDVQN